MKRVGLFLTLLFVSLPPVQAEDCQDLLREMELPEELDTRGKPRVAEWEEVDKILNEVVQRLEGRSCRLTFGQIFRTDREELFFPLTNSVVRIVPEDAFNGTTVYTNEGTELGPYVGRVRYERSGNLYAQTSYSLFYFQYRGSDDKLHSVGSQLLLDSFVVEWEDIKDLTAVETN